MALPLVLLVGAVCWLLGRSPDDSGEPMQPADSASPAIDRPGVSTAPPDQPDIHVTRTILAAAGPLAPMAEDARWIELRVVSKGTGAPLPGARVVWFDRTILARLDAEPALLGADAQELRRDPEALALRFGWQTTSDERGVARVTQAQSTRVAARHGSLYGEGHFPAGRLPPRDGFRLELAHDVALQVQVLDAAGAPAIGIPIALSAHDDQGKLTALWESVAVTHSRAPLGLATIPHTQRVQHAAAERPRWRVQTYLPGFVDQGVPVDLAAPPTEPVVLRLPPCGSVLVRIDVPGHIVAGPQSISLYEMTPKRRGDVLRPALVAPVDADGWARFRHVALGASLSAVGSAFGGFLNRVFPGPTQGNGEVRVELAPTDAQVLVVGRLLDPEQVPVAERRFELLISGRGPARSIGVRTDAAGRFVALAGRDMLNKTDLVFASLERPDEPPLQVALPGRDLRGPTADIGDLVLQRRALFVAGQFRIDGRLGKFEGGSPPRCERLEGDATGSPGAPIWRKQDGVSHFHGSDGRFSYRADVRPGRYRLTFAGKEYLPRDPIEFVPGQQDLTIDLQRGRDLAATVVAPREFGKRIELRLSPEFGRDAQLMPQLLERLSTEVQPGDDGRAQAQWRSLPAGTYRLEVRLPAVTTPVHTLDAVVVPGPPGGDLRLVDIDLTARLRQQVIRVFDAAGQPLRVVNGGVFPRGQGESGPLVGSAFAGHEARVTLPAGPFDLLVAVAGYQPREMLCDGAPLELRLEAWPTLAVTFPDLPPLPEGLSLWARLRPAIADARRFRVDGSGGELQELLGPPLRAQRVEVTERSGKAELPIGGVEYQLELRVSSQSKSAVVAMPAVAVRSAGAVAVAVPPEALAKAIEAARATTKR